MKTDAQIQQDVLDQIKWNPLLTASEIGVFVKNGVVTLSGRVDTYHKKMEAEREAKRVSGVKAIAEEIMVGVSPILKRTDEEIAQAVLLALKWHTSIPDEHIHVKVEDGIVTLEGAVEWAYQREAAKHAIVNLASVRDVINQITLKQKVTSADLKKKISDAFHRNATLDASKVMVEVSGNKVVLQGTVQSLVEKEEAENAIWQAPGIVSVENRIRVEALEEYLL